GVLRAFAVRDVFGLQDRVFVVGLLERFDGAPLHLSDQRDGRSLWKDRRIEEFFLHGEEQPLRLAPVRDRRESGVQRKLKDLDLGPVLQSFRIQHNAAEHDGAAGIILRRRLDLAVRDTPVNVLLKLGGNELIERRKAGLVRRLRTCRQEQQYDSECGCTLHLLTEALKDPLEMKQDSDDDV